MARRILGRLATWPLRVCVAIALLIDAPPQLELGARTSELLASVRARVAHVDAREPRHETNVATRAVAVVVTGVAWLAAVSLPYAEPYPDP